MKYIQSFWSKPSFHSVQNYSNSRRFGGWPNLRYFLISSLFSCLTIKRHHKNVELYTDALGYDLLINKFKIPYDNVTLNLNILENEDHKLWALGKLLTLKAQYEPFIHIDNDVYIWDKLYSDTSSNFILAQSSMPTPIVYIETLNEVNLHFSYVPACLKKSSTIANIGIIGGNNIDFFQKYCDEALLFLDKNRSNISKINVGKFNQILDEYLFGCMSESLGESIKFHIDSSKDIFPLESVLRFNLTPVVDKYIHLVGTAKDNFFACEQLEMRLKFEFPEYFHLFSKLFLEYYPEFSKEQDLIKINKSRAEKMSKAVELLYKFNINELKNKNYRLCENLEFIESYDSNFNNIKYFIKGKDPVTGQQIERELVGKDILFGYFIFPISLNSILEEIKTNNKNESEPYELHFMDWVTEKIFVTGEILVCE